MDDKNVSFLVADLGIRADTISALFSCMCTIYSVIIW